MKNQATHYMQDWLNRYKTMVEELENNPDVLILDNVIHPGCNDADITEVEAACSLKLPDIVKAFYSTANGIKLKWIHKDNEAFEDEKDKNDQDLQEGEKGTCFTGHIYLMPIKVAISDWHRYYEFEEGIDDDSECDFRGKKYSGKEMRNMVKPVDFVSSDECVGLIVDDGQAFLSHTCESDIPFCYLGNHGIVTWDSYFEFLIATYGVGSKRLDLFWYDRYGRDTVKVEGSEHGSYKLFARGKDFWDENKLDINNLTERELQDYLLNNAEFWPDWS